MLAKERLIILKCVKYGESDLIVHALNVKGARINFIAKAALKSKKRFGGGVLEPTHFIEAIYKKKSSDSSEGVLHFLQEAQLINGFVGIRSDYDRLRTALYFLQLVEKFSQEGTDDSDELFRLLGHALKALESSVDVNVMRTQFEIKILHLQGVLPQDEDINTLLVRSFSETTRLKIDTSCLSHLQSKVSMALSQYLG